MILARRETQKERRRHSQRQRQRQRQREKTVTERADLSTSFFYTDHVSERCWLLVTACRPTGPRRMGLLVSSWRRRKATSRLRVCFSRRAPASTRRTRSACSCEREEMSFAALSLTHTRTGGGGLIWGEDVVRDLREREREGERERERGREGGREGESFFSVVTG
jgi:hypothetical protein